FSVFSVISMVTTNPVYVSEPAMHPNLALGIIILPLSTLAFVLAIFLAIESPINTLYRGNSESDAQKNLLNFRQRSAKTTIITDEFNDMKLLVLDSTVFSKCMITEGNFKPFQLALTLKLSNLLYYNYTMNLSKMLFMSLMFDVSLKDINWAPSILMLTKCVAALLAVFLIDVFPRRIQYTISSLTTGTFLLAFGIVLATYDSVEVWVAPFLFITAEVFNAIAMHPMPDILLSEIFPLKKKTLSINSILICEYVGHMIVYIIYFNVPSNLQSTYIKTIVFGSVIILKSFIGLLAIPDTRSKTHREVIDLLQKGH
ncbi:uncharacterized protein LOC120431373, partial [Culex pipiens pallens]|uniref:uncharacterized protein LOC120431373 n=1 Tax=Culex pipiens pallens TaxID=42434 RepID=UPI00195480E6